MGIYKGAALCGIYVQWFALSLSLSVFVTVCMHIYTCMYKLHTHTLIHVCMYKLCTFNLLSFFGIFLSCFRLILVMLYFIICFICPAGQVVLDTPLPLKSHKSCRISSIKPIAVSMSERVQFVIKVFNLSRSSARYSFACLSMPE
jgi:hypothetical protein